MRTHKVPLSSSELDAAAIEAYVTAQMRSMRIPGLALGIVKDNQIIYLRGYGRADPSGRPVTPQTPFIVGSITKSFTALALMQLVEQGKVELDAPVQRYLPWFRLADPQASTRISLRHLLNHTSGIPRFVGRELLAGKGDATLERRVRELSTAELAREVGELFQYSNANYLVLGLVVQAVSQQSYEDYVRQHILAPLDMRHSFLSETDAVQNGMATGYRWWFGLPLPADLPYLSDALPAGFLLSSAQDMAQYLIAHLNDGHYGKSSVLSPAGIAELHRPGAVIPGTDAGYGMGWVTESIDGIPALTHSGDTANFHADMILVPGSQYGIVVLMNANNALVGHMEAVGKLGMWRIAAGVGSLLGGRQPPARRFHARMLYLALDPAVALFSLLQVWSLARLIQRWRQPFPRQPLSMLRRVLLPLTWELAIPLKLLISIPKLSGASWSVLKLYAPDLAYWLQVMLPFSFVTGILRAVLVFLKLRRGSHGDLPFH